MASISTALSLLQFQSVSLQPAIYKRDRISTIGSEIKAKFQFGSSYLTWNPRKLEQDFPVKVLCSLQNSDDTPVKNEVDLVSRDIVESRNEISKFRGTISTATPFVLEITRQLRANFATVLCIAVAFLVIAIREYVARKSRYNNHHGSVADLVKRGQLRSDRRGISRPLKYDDPFNNPLVKVSKSSSTVEMCGKVYRLAPVTLTEEEQSSHQKRRSRAYQWKRPTMFLKEGDSIPPDVDPDTVRWIPANHPFATTVNDIDEDLAQNNVFQKHGVPFRIKAEHEALQRKLESLQSEQKLNKMVIDPSSARDFERPFKSPSVERQKPAASQGGDSSTSPNSNEMDAESDQELKKP